MVPCELSPLYYAVGFFLLLNLFLGLGQGHSKTIESYALANRSLGTGVLIITIAATIISTNYIGIKMAISQEFGITAPIFEVTGHVVSAYVLAWHVFPKLLRFRHCYTLGDILGRIYGPYAQIFAGGLSILVSLLIIVAQFIAVGSLGDFLGIRRTLIILVIGTTVTTYTLLGGMRAVTRTGGFQFLLGAVGFLMIVNWILTLNNHEGQRSFEGLFEEISKKYPRNMQIFGHDKSWFCVLHPLSLSALLLLPPVIQSVLMVGNRRQVKQGFLGFAVLYTLFRFLLTTIGFRLLLTCGPDKIADPKAFGLLLKSFFPDGGGASFLLMVMLPAVVMSTAGSFLNAAVVTGVQDILKRLKTSNHSVSREAFWIKCLTMLVGGLATGLAIITDNLSPGTIIDLTIMGFSAILIPFILGTCGLKGDHKAFFASIMTFLTLLAGYCLLASHHGIATYFGWDSNTLLRKKYTYAFPIILLASMLVFLLTHYQHYGRLAWEKLAIPKERKRRFAEQKENFSGIFSQPLAWAKDKIEKYGSQPTLLALFLLFVGMCPEATKPHIPVSYARYSLFVRLLGGLLCIGLLLHRIWRHPFKRYFSLYWLLSLAYCLPFTYILHWLYNPMNMTAGLLLSLTTLLLYTLVDWRTYAFLNAVGTIMACMVYSLSGGDWHFEISAVWNAGLGVLLALLVGFLFVSRKEQVSEERIQHNKLWAGAFAHDLLNIFHNVKWLSKQRTNKEEEQVNAFAEIAAQTDEAIKQSIVFRDLIQHDYIRPQDMEVVSIKHIVATAHDLIATEYQSKVKRAGIGDFQIFVCKPIMRAVIHNLVKNAFWHGAANEVEISWDASLRRMYVKDNGKGIPPHVEPYIFDLYYSTSSTGIGLTFVKQVLTAMGASIELCTSATKTTFSITFPPVT